MGNCLVSKLKSVIDNPLLPKVDEVILHVSRISDYAGSTAILQLATFSSKSYRIEIIGNGVFTNTSFEDLTDPTKTMTSGTFQGVNSDQTYYFSDGDYYVKIKGIDYISRFRNQKYGSAKDTIFSITLSDFIGFNELRTLTLSRTNIYGDIKTLGNNTELTTIDTVDSGINGEINTLAEYQVAAGRTSGSLVIYCNNYITLSGVVVGNNVSKTITFSSSGYTVS